MPETTPTKPVEDNVPASIRGPRAVPATPYSQSTHGSDQHKSVATAAPKTLEQCLAAKQPATAKK